METNKDTFAPEYVYEYYMNTYGKTFQTKTDLETVKKFMELYGTMYKNDLDATCDLLKDYVLARKGLY